MTEKIWQLHELSFYIQTLLRENPDLKNIRVQGEITGYHFHQPSGHIYFALGEGEHIIQCAWFKADMSTLGFDLANGLKVIIRGSVTTYTGKSQYQLRVSEIAPAGLGTLYQAFENLKNKLESEGLFDESRKRLLPNFPKRIGLVTSPVGAARQDVEDNLRIRYPLADLVISGAQVQGEGAGESLKKALRRLLDRNDIDVIIIARGGGSFEDLYAFNDEGLARMISEAAVPIVTGVGHQKDFTIADFVADVRAGTPSHAVELCTPNIDDLRVRNVELKRKAGERVVHLLERKRLMVIAAERASFFHKAEAFIERKMQHLDDLRHKVVFLSSNRLKELRVRVDHFQRNLGLIDPQAIVDRGFAICYDKSGTVIAGIDAVSIGDKVTVQLKDGKFNSSVDGKEKGERKNI